MADPKFISDEQATGATAPAGAAGPAGPQPFAVRGDRNDEIKRQEAIDPTEVEEVTDEEQAQYDDLVSRCIAMISDSRVPEMEGGESPSDAVIRVMSNSAFSVPQALAEGTVSTMMILHDAAKRAEKPYTADVMFHASDEVIGALYILGATAGIFEGASEYAKGGMGSSNAAPAEEVVAPGQEAPDVAPTAAGAIPQAPAGNGAVPPAAGAMPTGEEMAPKPMADDAEGDFTDEEYALLAEAKMLATELFGRKLLESGQITEAERKEAQKFWQSQIQKEVETGQVDDNMFNDMDIDSIRQQITKSRGV